MNLKKNLHSKIESIIFRFKSLPLCKSYPLRHNNPSFGDYAPQFLYFLAVIFYVGYLLLMQPHWVLGGEMWAEMATNYFENASSPSFLVRFFATDAGYIPLPQRLIAFLANLFRFPASSIPYFYTWSAIFGTSLMVGIFCIERFRFLIPSDLMRFLVVLFVLMVVDFESRTFINFTYFACFYVTIITALVYADGLDECPWWVWICPILVLSKPAVLATLPAMVFVGIAKFKRNPIFLYVSIGSASVGVLQIMRMFLGSNFENLPIAPVNVTLFTQIIASFEYFFGFFGGYLIGQAHPLSSSVLITVGAITVFLILIFILRVRSREGTVILFGFSLIFFNVLLNCYSMNWGWNMDLVRLTGVPVFRHIIPAFFGSILVIAGFISLVCSRVGLMSNVAPIIFILWFLISGWFVVAGNLTRDPTSPTVNNSQWQKTSQAVDFGRSPLCVPIDPWWRGKSWIYERNCKLLIDGPDWGDGTYDMSDSLSVLIDVPGELSGKSIWFTALLVKPLSAQSQMIEAEMVIVKKSGAVKRFTGSRNLDAGGGLILLDGDSGIPVSEISSIRLSFNVPVRVAKAIKNSANLPGVAWMGN